ncbi:MAG: hypothetical protein ACR2NX_00615 [Chthoniobacterales bacterium]
MIAVTFALPSESSGFVRLLERVRHRPAQHIIEGSLHGHDVHVLHTGVGEKSTRERIGPFLKARRPSLLISSGFAGSLSEKLCVGDVFVAQNFSCDAVASDTLSFPRAKLATASTVLESPAERAQFARARNADAVDMETVWIAEACREVGIPILSLRVISDDFAEPLPAPARVLFDVNRQRTPLLRLAAHIAAHPAALPRLIRFAGRITRVRQNLTDALVRICTA